jgi:hypothetical protein
VGILRYKTMSKNQPICKIDDFGDKRWKLDGKLHNENGPAVEFADGTKCWFIHDKCHRFEIDPRTGLSLPAIEWSDGSKDWYRYGKFHRDELDPETGLSLPSTTYPDGLMYWYRHHIRHCEDGPAIVYPDGRTQYWINGKHLTKLDNKKVYGRNNLALCMLL